MTHWTSAWAAPDEASSGVREGEAGNVPDSPSLPTKPPEAKPKPKVHRSKPRKDDLGRQIAEALVDETEARKLTLPELATHLGLSLSSVRAHRYGQGMRVSTLEQIALAFGWQIAILDDRNNEIVRV